MFEEVINLMECTTLPMFWFVRTFWEVRSAMDRVSTKCGVGAEASQINSATCVLKTYSPYMLLSAD
ncbi:hypothetical protein ACTXT7_013325 [Hymenolepis weldensis]